jgi:two-component system nitrate/nitrite response regulator NarL
MMTRQEKNVFDLVATGLSSKEIAKKLFISVHTVETHRRNLRYKFNVRTTTEMIMKFYELSINQHQIV